MQFLSGLNETYDQTRRHIIIKSTQPTLNQAYALIIEDGSQNSGPYPTLINKGDPAAMQTGRGQLTMKNNRGK